jgi:Fic family protein
MNDNSKFVIGHYVHQPEGHKAFMPEKFPPDIQLNALSNETLNMLDKASLAVGKLDGITELLPDLDFFLLMYVRKEAAYSSEIEGTQATMIDAIRQEVVDDAQLPRDYINIVKYVEALNASMSRIKALPISSRFIKEVHQTILDGTPDGVGKTPGAFRTTQNWVGGATLATALYIPPPAKDLAKAMSDLESYVHAESPYSALIKAALLHAQFETIHPFLDGNGRTGRLMIPVYLCHVGLLDKPVLYLSAYLKKHRKTYFDHLTDYHDRGLVDPWLKFFFTGICEVAESAVQTAGGIHKLRKADEEKIRTLAPKRRASAEKLYQQLFTSPIVTIPYVEKVTGLSRPAANALVKDLVDLKVLQQRGAGKYAREFAYKDYISLFTSQ